MSAQLTVFNGLPFVRPSPAQIFSKTFPPPGCTLSVSSYTPLPACRCVGGQLTQERQVPSAKASMDRAACWCTATVTTAHGSKQQATTAAKGGLPKPARTAQSPSAFAQKVTMHLFGSSNHTHITGEQIGIITAGLQGGTPSELKIVKQTQREKQQ